MKCYTSDPGDTKVGNGLLSSFTKSLKTLCDSVLDSYEEQEF